MFVIWHFVKGCRRPCQITYVSIDSEENVVYK